MVETNSLPPVKLAFIDSNNNVMDIIHTDDRLAAILLSEPIFVDVTGPNGEPLAEFGWLYDPETKTISKPIPSDMPSIDEDFSL